MIDGIGSPPFSATTLPPIAVPQVSYRDVAVASSRKQFARPRADVEQEIIAFHQPVVVPKREVIPAAVRDKAKEHTTTPAPRREGERRERPTDTHREPREQRNDRPAETPKERPQPAPRPAQRSEANSEELRSILKRIANKETEKPETPRERKPESADRTELKDALKSIIANQPVATPAPVSVAGKEESPQSAQPQQPAQVVQEANPTQKGTLTPKELERMMRVTVHDKPPV